MKYDDLAQKQYNNIDNLSRLLKNYVDSYRLLIASALELYNINIVKKSDMKKALERVEGVGGLIDKLIYSIDKCEGAYLKYCKIKNEYMTVATVKDKIYTEIDEELDFQNLPKRDEEDNY
ncbi:MAG: hypothetical protein E7207_06045 [Clostridium butyricum]|nr:hypothetical protein [Clostridium butyricum]